MQIKETQLRYLIRQSLITEIDTSFRTSSRIASSRAKECSFKTKIPAKFLSLFSSENIQDLRNKIFKKIPDLGVITKKLDADIASLDRILPTLMSYITSYSYAIGTSCFNYYIVFKALQIIEGFFVMIGALDPIKRVTSDDNNDGIPSPFEFTLAIKTKANNMGSNRNTLGFVNNFPFYSLPNLSEEGANANNLVKFKADLEHNENLISEINGLRANTGSRLFSKITEILEIDDLNKVKKAKAAFSDSEMNQRDVEGYKKAAIAGITSSITESMRSYTDVLAVDGEFKEAWVRFQRRHS